MPIAVTVNDCPVSIEGRDLPTLGHVLKALTQTYPSGHVASCLRVNGRDISSEEEACLSPAPAHEIETIEVTTTHPDAAAVGGLQTCVEALDLATHSLTEAAQCMRLGREQESGDPLARGLTQISNVVEFVAAFAAYVRRSNAPAGESSGGGATPDPMRAGVNEIERTALDFEWPLSEMLTAQECRDLVLAADLLEYEVLPLIQVWRKGASTLYEAVVGQGRTAAE